MGAIPKPRNISVSDSLGIIPKPRNISVFNFWLKIDSGVVFVSLCSNGDIRPLCVICFAIKDAKDQSKIMSLLCNKISFER